MNNFRLKSNKNQLFYRRLFFEEHDDSSEHADKSLQTVNRFSLDVNDSHENNSSKCDKPLYRINNIYMIGNFNASVKMGENDFETNKNKKSQIKTTKTSVCNSTEVNPTKIRMAEYFEKSGNTGKSTFSLNLSTAAMQMTENNLENAYHYPSKTKV